MKDYIDKIGNVYSVTERLQMVLSPGSSDANIGRGADWHARRLSGVDVETVSPSGASDHSASGLVESVLKKTPYTSYARRSALATIPGLHGLSHVAGSRRGKKTKDQTLEDAPRKVGGAELFRVRPGGRPF